MDQAHTFMARVAGGVLLTFGIAVAILAIWIVERQLTLRGSLQSTAAALVISFSLISAFCVLLGYRLLFNRPNRYGSLLPPIGWLVLAICFGVTGVGIAVFAIWRGEYQLLVAPVALGVLGYRCVVAGRAAAGR